MEQQQADTNWALQYLTRVLEREIRSLFSTQAHGSNAAVNVYWMVADKENNNKECRQNIQKIRSVKPFTFKLLGRL